MISAVSKNGAAISANRIISTAEMAKFGAITQLGPLSLPNVDSNNSKSAGGESGRADHGVDAVQAQPRQRVARRVSDREVDHHVARRIGERMEVLGDRHALHRFAEPERIDGGGENEIGVSGDSSTNGSTHSSCCSVDPDSHECSLADPVTSDPIGSPVPPL